MTVPLPAINDPPAARDDDAGFGALSTPSGNLPLKSVDVRTRIDGLLARTSLKQTFVNPHAEALEATYIFPMPDRAAVTRFRLSVAGRVIEGELQERSKAREIYEKALSEGRRAAIAEEERPNVFTMRVGNLPPGESATVELTLTGPLPVDHGEATFRFPLVVAPRYIPGTPLPGESVGDGTHADTDAVPDASRITPPVLLPGQPNAVRLSLNVEVHSGLLKFSDFRSSLHTVQEEQAGEGLFLMLQPGERLDRDFILRFRVDDAQIRTGLHFQPDADNPSAGTFALTLVPPHESESREKPRDVVFVLDRSGSMDGWKMLAARRALGRMVDSLTDRDRFAVLAFDDRIDPFPADGSLQLAADRQRFRAVEFLAGVDARGGTELAAPLERALALLPPSGEGGSGVRERILVLVTDGQVGNEDQILKALAERLKGIRVFTLGIDQAVNEGFLKRLAGLGGGYCELVESEDRLDAVLDKVHRRIRSPLLMNLKLEPAGLTFEPGTLVPERLPDLFPGTPVTILGRYRLGGKSAVPKGLSLQATDEAGQPWAETVSGERGEVLAPVWARGHLRELEDRHATGRGDRTGLEQRIIATSLRFGVLCRFTAFVAVDVKEVVNAGGEVRSVTQPVEPAAGWDMLRQEEDAPRLGNGGFVAMSVNLMRSAAPSASAVPIAPVERVDAMLMDFDRLDLDVAVTPPPAPAAPAPRQSRSPGTTPPSAGKQNAGAAAPDLSAYRQRADELRHRLESADDVVRELGVLARKLEELLDDLQSTDASDEDRQPLTDLLTELRTFLAQGSPPADEAAAMAKRVGDALAAFARGAEPKRRGWWK